MGIKYKAVRKNGEIVGYANTSKYTLVFYADDFVIMCENKEDAERVEDILKEYLEIRGLRLSEEKTMITNVDKGFDFLGFNIRMYQTCQGEKLLIKPSRNSVKKSKRNDYKGSQTTTGINVNALISKLNPIVIGTANNWSPWVSKRTYGKVDYHVWRTTFRFLKKLHPKKSADWIWERYYKPDKTGQSRDRWILTDPLEKKQLIKMAWTPIVRHPLIRYKASPYDIRLKEYYEGRDIKEFDRNSIKSRQKMAKRQNYKCPICNTDITNFAEKLTVKEKVPTIYGRTREYKNLELVHTYCNSQFYKLLPLKGEMPSRTEINKCYKEIRKQRMAEVE